MRFCAKISRILSFSGYMMLNKLCNFIVEIGMENKSVAIFIDAENIPAKYAKSIFDIASDYREIIIKRIYGDWTQKRIQAWKEQIAEYSLIAMQQFNFVANKNSSDMYLMAEIISIFYEKDIDIFSLFQVIAIILHSHKN